MDGTCVVVWLPLIAIVQGYNLEVHDVIKYT